MPLALVTFETASFADAVKKAAILAPSTGQAFDKCGGIMIDVDPAQTHGWSIQVRTSNLDIYRTEWVDPIAASGDATAWRMPAKLLATVVGSLPIGSGKTITLEEKIDGLQKYVRLTSGRTKARINLMRAEDYPNWANFDPASLSEATDLGGRISQVEWAAAKSEAPLAGVHFNGEMCIATNKYRLAAAPLVIPNFSEPFTVPAGLLSQLLRETGEVKVGIEGEQFLVMPDEHTQLRCILYGQPYPGVRRLMNSDRPQRIKIRKKYLLDILQRAASYASGDRDAALRLWFGEEEIAVVMANREMGMLGDAIEIPGQADHDRTEIMFSPDNIITALNNAPNEEVEIAYDIDKPTQAFHIDGGSGYLCWVMPRQKMRPEAEEKE